MERLLRGAQVIGRRAGAIAAALEVPGEHPGIRLPALLEPLAGEAMPEPPVLLGQGGVGALAEQRVAERELALAGKLARRLDDQELLLHEPGAGAGVALRAPGGDHAAELGFAAPGALERDRERIGEGRPPAGGEVEAGRRRKPGGAGQGVGPGGDVPEDRGAEPTRLLAAEAVADNCLK